MANGIEAPWLGGGTNPRFLLADDPAQDPILLLKRHMEDQQEHLLVIGSMVGAILLGELNENPVVTVNVLALHCIAFQSDVLMWTFFYNPDWSMHICILGCSQLFFGLDKFYFYFMVTWFGKI
jgi:hypothetical protein